MSMLSHLMERLYVAGALVEQRKGGIVVAALATSLLLSSGPARAEIIVAGLSFEDNAFADRVMSTDFTGIYGSCDGSAATLSDAMVGANIDSWIDYGYHDNVPGPDGDYNSEAPPYQYVEMAFTDNVAVNASGDDIALFQVGTVNSILIALDKESILNPYAATSRAIIVDVEALAERSACNSMTVGYLDLSDLGVAANDTVYRIYVPSPLILEKSVGRSSADTIPA